MVLKSPVVFAATAVHRFRPLSMTILQSQKNTDTDRLVDDWQSFDDYVNRNSSKPVADNGNGTGSPASGKNETPAARRREENKKNPSSGSGRSRNTDHKPDIRFIKLPQQKTKTRTKKARKKEADSIYCSHFFNHRKRKTGRHPVLSCDPVDLRSPDGFVHPSYGTELLGQPGDLGSIAGVVQEKNYAQGIYLIGALICVGFGCIQALWIASRKRMPDHGKIRQVDMGRGLFGFVVLVLLAFVSTYAYPILPASPAPLEGAKLFFHIVDDLGKSFLFMNVIGAVLCVVRKMGTR